MNTPEYYNMPITPIEYIQKNGLGFCEGNVIKYISRWKHKGGVSDLQKAKDYIERLIEYENGSIIKDNIAQCE